MNDGDEMVVLSSYGFIVHDGTRRGHPVSLHGSVLTHQGDYLGHTNTYALSLGRIVREMEKKREEQEKESSHEDTAQQQ